MSLNFPNTPTDGQTFTDASGQQWIYEASTNSWTAVGLQGGGISYKGAIDVTAAAPAGVKSGWMYSVSTGGTPHVSFSGLADPTAQGGLIIYNGAKWENISSVSIPPASESVAGVVELATAAETTAGTDGTRAVHPAGLKVELDKKVDLAGGTMTGGLTVPSLVSTGDVQAASLNGGQLAGFRNILINGNLKINQRGVDVASAATGSYGQDRWKKTAGGMTQVIEEGNFEPGATYTLSGTGITTQQITAPGTGSWTLPDIPVTARKIQLELGTVATPFEHRPIGTELALCQRYYQQVGGKANDDILLQMYGTNGTPASMTISLTTSMRTSPTATKVGTWPTAGCGQPSVVRATTEMLTIHAISNATREIQFASTTSAYFTLDAEL